MHLYDWSYAFLCDCFKIGYNLNYDTFKKSIFLKLKLKLYLNFYNYQHL